MADIIVKGLTLGGVESISAEGADGGTIEFLPESDLTLQEKSVTPTDTEQTIVPDSGYYGLSKVTVGAGGGGDLPAAEKVSVTASTASLADAYEIQGSTLLGLLQSMIGTITPTQPSIDLSTLIGTIIPHSQINWEYADPSANPLTQDSDGYWYYYVNGERQKTGLTVIGGSVYYLSQITGRAAVGVDVLAILDAGVHSSASAIGYGAGNYAFDENGRMVEYVQPSPKTGAFYEGGAIWYYANGSTNYKGAILDGCGDAMYFASNKQAVVGVSYSVGAGKLNGILSSTGNPYSFDDNGRCTNPVWA